MKKALLVGALLLASVLALTPQIVEGGRTIGTPGLVRSSGPLANTPPSASFFATIDTTAGVTTYTFESNSTDATGTVDTLSWYVNGNLTVKQTAATDTIQRVLGPGIYTVTLVAQDDEGATGVAQQGFKRQDIRGVASELTQTRVDPTSSFPLMALRFNPGLIDGSTFNNTASIDYADTAVTATLDLLAQADIIQYQLSRAFTAAGQAFHDSVLARDPDTKVIHYTRFNHAPTNFTLSGQTYEQAEAGAGPVEYFADTVWQDYIAVNAAGDSMGIFGDGSGDIISYFANHWKTRSQEDLPPGTYDYAIVKEYADSLASVLNRYPDGQIDAIMMDYFALAPNVYIAGGSGAYGGGIDFDEDGTNDYVSYTWVNEELRNSYYDWQLAHLREMAQTLDGTAITFNGNFFDDVSTLAFALQEGLTFPDSVYTYAEGINFEEMRITENYGKGGDPYGRILQAAALYDVYGFRWSKMSVPPDPTISDAERARIIAIYSMLGGAMVELKGYNTREKVRTAYAAVADIDAGEPLEGGNLIVDDLGFSQFRLSREFENGRAEATFSVNSSGEGYPITRDGTYTETVRWVPTSTDPTLTADFNFTNPSGDSLRYFFTDASTIDAGSIDSWQYLVSSSQLELLDTFSQEDFNYTFPAKAGPNNYYEVSLIVNGAGLFSVKTDSVWVAVPAQPNVAPTARFTTNSPADGLSYTFNASTSSDPDGSILSYRWDFGEPGATSSEGDPNTAYTYSYCDCARTVQLVVEDNDGATDTTTTDLTIPAAPPAPSGTPNVTSVVSGTLSDGNTIVIAGTDFGTKPGTDAPKLWYDFENGTNGVEFEDTAVDPFGTFSDNDEGRKSQFEAAGSRTGSSLHAFLRAGSQVPANGEIAREELKWTGSASDFTQRGFVSYWMKRNVKPDNPQSKLVYLRTETDSEFNEERRPSLQHTIGAGNQWNRWTMVTNNTNPGITANEGSSRWSWSTPADTWHRITFLYDMGTANQLDGYFWTEALGGGANNTIEDFDVGLRGTQGNTIRSHTWLAYAGNEENYPPVDYSWEAFNRFDDVYWDNTWARIELGDSPSYSTCTFREMQVPSAWANGEITFTFNQGAFSNGTAYLFVVNSENTISTGFPITVGGTVTPPDPPVADFSANDTTVTTANTVVFTDESTNDPTSWEWRTGDNQKYTTQNPSHTYSAAGTYSVTLAATNAAGTDSLTKTDYITVTSNAAPTASLSVTQGDSLTTITLDGSLSTDSDGTVDSLRFVPWPGASVTAIPFATGSVTVDYTSQQTGSEQTLTASLVAVDNEGGESTADTANVIVKGSGSGVIREVNFDGGSLPADVTVSANLGLGDWTATVTNGTSPFSAQGGSWYLNVLSSTPSQRVLFLDIPVDLTGETNVYVEFYSNRDYSDGFLASEGVYLSSDGGSSFTKISTEGIAINSLNTWTPDDSQLDSDGPAVTFNSNNVVRINFVLESNGGSIAFDSIKIASGTKTGF